MTQAKTEMFDIVVVGGGMVGATTALGLAQSGFKVAVVEKFKPSLDWSPSDPFETRVSALTRASQNILQALGAWQGIASRRHHAFTGMHVWETISDAEIHFSAEEINEPNLGYVVENKVVQIALWERLLDNDNITLLTEKVLVSLNTQPDLHSGVQVTLAFDDGEQLSARLVVGADGAFSKVRELAGIELQAHDYQQCAVVGCVATEQHHQNVCWQRYREEGPFAYLAMDENMSSIAWYLPIEKMQWALSLDDDAFAKAITEASGECLGQVVKVGKRDAFPLVRRHASDYVKPGVVLVGDAAHTIHPQAGQGVNLGLLDAAALVETLTQAKQTSDFSWNRVSVLRRYQRWRKGDNAIVQRSMEGFDWLFGQDSDIKNALRKNLLPMANRMQGAKNWLMRQALDGRYALPELAKNEFGN